MKIEEMKKANVVVVNTLPKLMPALTKELAGPPLHQARRHDRDVLRAKAQKLDYIVQYALDNGYMALMTFGAFRPITGG